MVVVVMTIAWYSHTFLPSYENLKRWHKIDYITIQLKELSCSRTITTASYCQDYTLAAAVLMYVASLILVKSRMAIYFCPPSTHLDWYRVA